MQYFSKNGTYLKLKEMSTVKFRTHKSEDKYLIFVRDQRKIYRLDVIV